MQVCPNASITEEIDDGQSEFLNFQRKLSNRSKKNKQLYQIKLQKFLVLIPLIKKTNNSVSWWKKHYSEFPKLKKILF